MKSYKELKKKFKNKEFTNIIKKEILEEKLGSHTEVFYDVLYLIYLKSGLKLVLNILKAEK